MSAGRGSGISGGRGDRPPQLRRPMDSTADDLARGIAKMEPYGSDQGRFSYGQTDRVTEPPRPAPNADGWSSGENQIHHWGFHDEALQQQQQQQQQQQHLHQNFPHPSEDSDNMYGYGYPAARSLEDQQSLLNARASEFVPKSNLSANAQVFVPRQMPRNTSHMSYQQEQEQLQHQQQQQEFAITAQQQDQFYGRGGERGGGSGRSGGYHHPAAAGGGGASMLYGPSDALSDAISTIAFMPSKFDRTAPQLAEKLNSSIFDQHTLEGIARDLVEVSLSEPNFAPMSGMFCNFLVTKVTVNFDGVTLNSLLCKRLQEMCLDDKRMLDEDGGRFGALMTLIAGLYLTSTESRENFGSTVSPLPEAAAAAAAAAQGSTGASNETNLLADLFRKLLFRSTTPVDKRGDEESTVSLAADLLMFAGKQLRQAEEQDAENKLNPTVDDIIANIGKCKNLVARHKKLKELRDNNWTMEAADRPNHVLILQSSSQPASSTNGRVSNAIAIVKPSVEKVSKTCDGGEAELTEAELRFMNEQLEGDNCSDVDAQIGPNGDGLRSEEDQDLPEDVEAALQEFLEEQESRQRNGS